MAIQVRSCLHGILAQSMARRMCHTDWSYWSSAELDTDDIREPSIEYRLAAQRDMGVKRTNVTYKLCASCGAEEGPLVKCGKCLSTYYCNARCQREHWRAHRLSCSPPEPKTESDYAVALPDSVASRLYQANAIGVDLGVLILSGEEFEHYFGRDAILKTLVRLAHTGKPHPYLINVTRSAKPENYTDAHREVRLLVKPDK